MLSPVAATSAGGGAVGVCLVPEMIKSARILPLLCKAGGEARTLPLPSPSVSARRPRGTEAEWVETRPRRLPHHHSDSSPPASPRPTSLGLKKIKNPPAFPVPSRRPRELH